MDSLESLSQKVNDHIFQDEVKEKIISDLKNNLSEKLDRVIFIWIMGLFVTVNITVWGVLYSRQEKYWTEVTDRIQYIQESSQNTAVSVARIQGILENNSKE